MHFKKLLSRVEPLKGFFILRNCKFILPCPFGVVFFDVSKVILGIYHYRFNTTIFLEYYFKLIQPKVVAEQKQYAEEGADGANKN